MQVKETTKYAFIVLDKDEDFQKPNLKEILKKAKNYKQLPFHDVILKMDSKYSVKFWEILTDMDLKYKEAEIKDNTFLIKL